MQADIRDTGSVLGLGRSPGEGPGNQVLHSRILAWRIPMDRGAWWAKSTGSQRVRHN